LSSPSISVGTTICGVDHAITGCELVTFFEMQELILVRQPFEVRAMRTRKLACER